jgi:serine/threonine protein kinase
MATGSHISVGAGRYELLEQLGEGEFGVVYRGLDLDEGCNVAVKLFKEGVKLESALTEAQLQRRLSEHPRIVSLRNVDVRTSAGPIVVTEYMPGGSVDKRIGEGPAGLLHGLRWTIDAADALAHAHANDVFHRDAKPSNLLLDDSDHARLCDFGVAEDSFVAAGGGMLYAMLGAPEQGSTGTTEKTEVWMLGALLHRLVLGSYPYPSGSASLNPGTTVRPQDHDPQIPMAMERIMKRALAIDPADRFATVRELRDELLAIVVVTEFGSVRAPGTVASWQAPIAAGSATVEVLQSPRATFTTRLRIDRGSGPRTLQTAPRRSTERQAVRDARTLLHAVVEGRLP